MGELYFDYFYEYPKLKHALEACQIEEELKTLTNELNDELKKRMPQKEKSDKIRQKKAWLQANGRCPCQSLVCPFVSSSAEVHLMHLRIHKEEEDMKKPSMILESIFNVISLDSFEHAMLSKLKPFRDVLSPDLVRHSKACRNHLNRIGNILRRKRCPEELMYRYLPKDFIKGHILESPRHPRFAALGSQKRCSSRSNPKNSLRIYLSFGAALH